jgi:hypothetical protein
MNYLCRGISLNEIRFVSESNLREIDGFYPRISVHQIAIPTSIETIDLNGFCGSKPLQAVTIRAGC